MSVETMLSEAEFIVLRLARRHRRSKNDAELLGVLWELLINIEYEVRRVRNNKDVVVGVN